MMWQRIVQLDWRSKYTIWVQPRLLWCQVSLRKMLAFKSLFKNVLPKRQQLVLVPMVRLDPAATLMSVIQRPVKTMESVPTINSVTSVNVHLVSKERPTKRTKCTKIVLEGIVTRLTKGSNCEITPCSTNPCQNNGVCRLSGSTYQCSCDSLYSQALQLICISLFAAFNPLSFGWVCNKLTLKPLKAVQIVNWKLVSSCHVSTNKKVD